MQRIDCKTCGLNVSKKKPIKQETTFMCSHKLKRKNARYLPKSERPEYADSSKELAKFKKLKKEKQLAAKAHEFLYVVMPAKRKQGIFLGDNVIKKIIWEYLVLRGIIFETFNVRKQPSAMFVGTKELNYTITDWSMVFPAQNFECRAEIPSHFRENNKNRVFAHCVVCDDCRKQLMKKCIHGGNHDGKQTAVANRLTKLKWNKKECDPVITDDILAAISLFKYSYHLR